MRMRRKGWNAASCPYAVTVRLRSVKRDESLLDVEAEKTEIGI